VDRHATAGTVTIDASLSTGDKVSAGSLTADVLHTPGHTEGSICLYFAPEKKLIAGDTLFAGSIGRTDLPAARTRRLWSLCTGRCWLCRTRRLLCRDMVRSLPSAKSARPIRFWWVKPGRYSLWERVRGFL